MEQTQSMTMDNAKDKEDTGGLTTNIYTYNVRGLRDALKRKRIFTYIKEKMSGIIFLQETHTVQSDLIQWQKEWEGQVYISSGTNQSKGVAVLISPNIELTLEKQEIDSNGRYILLNGTFNGRKLCLLNVYAPTADKKK